MLERGRAAQKTTRRYSPVHTRQAVCRGTTSKKRKIKRKIKRKRKKRTRRYENFARLVPPRLGFHISLGLNRTPYQISISSPVPNNPPPTPKPPLSLGFKNPLAVPRRRRRASYSSTVTARQSAGGSRGVRRVSRDRARGCDGDGGESRGCEAEGSCC
jgi:hypothetical protein